jgi:hypothetical protein
VPVINVGEPAGPALWEPAEPRRPGPMPALIAFGLVVVAVAVGLVALNDALASRYAPRADVCASADLRALSTLAGNAPSVIAPDPNLEQACQIQFTAPDRPPVAVGRLWVNYTGNRLGSRIGYAAHDAAEFSPLAGVGEEGRLAITPECGFVVAVRDVNVLVNVSLTVVGGRCPDRDAATAALTTAVRGTLTNLK